MAASEDLEVSVDSEEEIILEIQEEDQASGEEVILEIQEEDQASEEEAAAAALVQVDSEVVHQLHQQLQPQQLPTQEAHLQEDLVDSEDSETVDLHQVLEEDQAVHLLPQLHRLLQHLQLRIIILVLVPQAQLQHQDQHQHQDRQDLEEDQASEEVQVSVVVLKTHLQLLHQIVKFQTNQTQDYV